MAGTEAILITINRKLAISEFPEPLYQNEVKSSAFDMEMIFHYSVTVNLFSPFAP